MLKYVVNRLLSLIPVILVTSFLIYWAMSLTEGDPAMMIAGDGASKEMIDRSAMILVWTSLSCCNILTI